MITINEITIDEKKYLTGMIGKTTYSIVKTDDVQQALVGASKTSNAAETLEDVKNIEEEILNIVLAAETVNSSSLEEVLKDDLYLDVKAETYHVKLDNKIGKIPVNKFFVDKMIEANDKGLSPKPWLIFWVRLMRNDLYKNSPEKVNQIVSYLKATYQDDKNVEKLIEQGYSVNISNQLSTFDQISITEQGILAAFKYVRLLDKKFVVEKNEETGEQTIVEKDKYERVLEVDEDTGEITKDELELPEWAEEFKFEPPIMGTGGDPFTSRDLGDTQGDIPTGHIVKVGKVHELSNGFSQVNTNDSSWGVKGLHLGGYYYVQNFGGKTDYLVDCLVSPEDIGAVSDIRDGNGDGAIRCKRYMVVGAHFQVSKGMYHPSKYAKMLDEEWDIAKAEAIQALKEQIINIEA